MPVSFSLPKKCWNCIFFLNLYLETQKQLFASILDSLLYTLQLKKMHNFWQKQIGNWKAHKQMWNPQGSVIKVNISFSKHSEILIAVMETH